MFSPSSAQVRASLDPANTKVHRCWRKRERAILYADTDNNRRETQDTIGGGKKNVCLKECEGGVSWRLSKFRRLCTSLMHRATPASKEPPVKDAVFTLIFLDKTNNFFHLLSAFHKSEKSHIAKTNVKIWSTQCIWMLYKKLITYLTVNIHSLCCAVELCSYTSGFLVRITWNTNTLCEKHF